MASEFSTDGLENTLIILGAAGIVIPAFARLRITPIVGFLLVGILVGPMGLGTLAGAYPWLNWLTISDTEGIARIGDFGIILLLFSIGLELSFRRLWRMRAQVFGLGSAELFGGAILIGAVLYAVGYSPTEAIGLGLALSLSSTALVIPIAGTSSSVGRSAFAMLLFEDLAIVPIVFTLGVLGPQAANGGGWAGLLTLAFEGLAVVIIMLIAGRFLLPPIFGQAARTKSPELFISSTLLVVILSSLATSAVGLSPIVGALIAGLLIAETDYRGEVESVVQPFKGLALGVFLISIGMQIDMRFVLANWHELAAAVVMAVAINAFVVSGLLKFSGARTGVATETGLLMASPSETTLIVLGAASAAQIIDAETAKFWQVATAIGLLITPILARIGHDVARRIEVRTSGLALEEENRAASGPRTVIIGFGRVGQLVAEMLKMHEQGYIAVDDNVDVVVAARREGHNVMFGDVGKLQLLHRLQLESAKALVLTMDDPVLAARTVKYVRSEHPQLTIIARARDAEHAAQLYLAGATDAVPESLESSLQLSEAVLVDLGMAMGPVIASIHEKRDEFRRAIKEAGELEEAPRLKLRSRLSPPVQP
jgi:CPA2 family monovalent cation:H+ antiporter-2